MLKKTLWLIITVWLSINSMYWEWYDLFGIENAINNVTRGINWISTFFVTIFDWLVNILSFVWSFFQFIAFAISSIFNLFSSLF